MARLDKLKVAKGNAAYYRRRARQAKNHYQQIRFSDLAAQWAAEVKKLENP